MDNERITHLKGVEEKSIHISHFMSLVSAYHPSEEMLEALSDDIKEAFKVAKKTRESQIVSQDCNDFFFVVHPSRTIDLCCRMRSYVVHHG